MNKDSHPFLGFHLNWFLGCLLKPPNQVLSNLHSSHLSPGLCLTGTLQWPCALVPWSLCMHHAPPLLPVSLISSLNLGRQVSRTSSKMLETHPRSCCPSSYHALYLWVRHSVLQASVCSSKMGLIASVPMWWQDLMKTSSLVQFSKWTCKSVHRAAEKSLWGC